ncbi:MAG: oligosaccharide flippase family protein [Saccharofermentans sp.]|nr:oligosaccharide flippase family protein [Saccharofermentans sp.]
MGKQQSIKKNFVMNVILTVSGIIFPIVTFPYVGRVLGPSGTGKVDFATSIIGYFALFAQLGIPTYGIRACAKVRDDKRLLSKTVFELLTINIVMTILSYICLIIAISYIPKLQTEKTLLLIISTTMIFNAIGIDYLYRAIEQYTYITLRSLMFKAIAFVSVFLLVKNEEDYVVYGAITIFAVSASNIMNLIHSRRYISKKNIGRLNIRQHFKPIATFLAMSCATTVYLNLDRVMLGFMKTDVDVGYYGAAVKIKNIMVSVVTSLGAVLLPRASYYVEHGLMDEFRKITTKALSFVFVIASPLMAYFIIFARPGILVVSGEEYLPAVPAMQVIMPTLMFIGITNILGIQILLPLGKEKYVLYSEIAGAVVDLVLNIWLIPIWGATGAAMGTVVAEFVVLLVQLILLKKIYLENPILDSFKHIKYVYVGISLTASSVLAVLLDKRLSSVGWVSGFTKKNSILVNNTIVIVLSGLLFFGIYYVIMLLLKDEMMLEITSTVLGKLRRKKR